MAIEYFDVVDKHDQPIGTKTTKAVAHAENILHRCVAIYVFDASGRLCVQSHLKDGLLDHSVGGHVSAGEDYLVAARREGEEELGLYDQPLNEIALSVYSDENFNGVDGAFNMRPMHMFGIYECHPDAEWKFVPNDEVQEITPMDIADIVAQMNEQPGKFTPGFIRTMRKYLEVKGLPYDLDLDRARTNWGATR